MPLYEYYCPTCRDRYELLRAMDRSHEAGTCPQGHGGGTRTLSVFAAVSKDSSGAAMPMAGGGGACGGGCGCGH